MKRDLRVLATASAPLLSMGTASAQKQGGILKIGHFDSPASMSMLEESTLATNRPMMGVFNTPTREGRPALLHQFSLAALSMTSKVKATASIASPSRSPAVSVSIDRLCPSRSTQEEFLKWKNHLASP